jgi:glycosyltransferase involved in cell wall biosynthesis
MKVNFFTPLPPAASDVAQCAARCMDSLAERFEVTFWTDARVDRDMRRRARVRAYDPASIDVREINHADLNLYSVGNDPAFHASVMQVALRVPGVVILHDVCVHELMHGTMRRGPASVDRYLETLRACGEEALADGRRVVEGSLNIQRAASRNPVTWWALQGALGVVSHNADFLLGAMPRLDIPLLDTPLPWLPAARMAAPRARTLDGRLELVICGFLNSPNRRLAETLEALASYPRKDRVLLHIAGRVKDRAGLESQIRSLGLGGNVRLHGFLSERDLGALLDRSHMAVNLRWPSVGEASGSQLRFWNHSLPSVATRTGWYARQPEGVLMYAGPDDERGGLHAAWDAALDEYPALVRMGLAGRALLEERHDAGVFARALEDFMPSVERHRARAFVPCLAKSAGEAIASLGVGDGASRIMADTASLRIFELAGGESC